MASSHPSIDWFRSGSINNLLLLLFFSVLPFSAPRANLSCNSMDGASRHIKTLNIVEHVLPLKGTYLYWIGIGENDATWCYPSTKKGHFKMFTLWSGEKGEPASSLTRSTDNWGDTIFISHQRSATIILTENIHVLRRPCYLTKWYWLYWLNLVRFPNWSVGLGTWLFMTTPFCPPVMNRDQVWVHHICPDIPPSSPSYRPTTLPHIRFDSYYPNILSYYPNIL